MSTIPKEIQEEAERRFPNREYNNKGGYTDQEYNILFKQISDEIKQRQQDFIQGYQLATDGREELEKENERLQNVEIELEKKTKSSKEWCDKAMEAARDRQDMRKFITALQSQCIEKEKEIEKWYKESQEAWRKIEIYKDEADRYKKEYHSQIADLEELKAENEGNKEIARARGEAINELQEENERLRKIVDIVNDRPDL